MAATLTAACDSGTIPLDTGAAGAASDPTSGLNGVPVGAVLDDIRLDFPHLQLVSNGFPQPDTGVPSEPSPSGFATTQLRPLPCDPDPEQQLIGARILDESGEEFEVVGIDVDAVNSKVQWYRDTIGTADTSDDTFQRCDASYPGTTEQVDFYNLSWTNGVDLDDDLSEEAWWMGDSRFIPTVATPTVRYTGQYHAGFTLHAQTPAGTDVWAGTGCTAYMISDNVAVTSAHCVVGIRAPDGQEDAWGNPHVSRRWDWHPHLLTSNPAGTVFGQVCLTKPTTMMSDGDCGDVRRIIVPKSYFDAVPTVDNRFGGDPQTDFALLVLRDSDSPIGANTPFILSENSDQWIRLHSLHNVGLAPPVDRADPDCAAIGPPNTHLQAFEHRFDGAPTCVKQTLRSSGAAVATPAGIVGGRYDAEQGHSGGPILRFAMDGRPLVVGTNSYHAPPRTFRLGYNGGPKTRDNIAFFVGLNPDW